MSKLFLKAFLVSIFMLFTSCSFFEASPGEGTTFQYGKMTGVVEANLKKCNNAALKTIKEFEFKKIENRKDTFTAILIVDNAKNETITITMEKMTKTSTKISIKVDLIGDQLLSQQIFDEIKDKL